MSDQQDVLDSIRISLVNGGWNPYLAKSMAERILMDLKHRNFEVMERKVEVGIGEFPHVTYVQCTKCSTGLQKEDS